MSKKRKNKAWNGGSNSQQSQATTLTSATDQRIAEINDAYKESQSGMVEEDLAALTSEPHPDGANLDNLWEMVRDARDIFRSRTRSAEQALARVEELEQQCKAHSKELDENISSLEKRRTEIAELEGEAAERLETLDMREKDLAAKDADLVARETDLRNRELNAEAGFVAERRAALAALEDVAATLRTELANTERKIAEERAAWLAEQLEQRKKFHEQLQAELDVRRNDAEEKLRQREEENQKIRFDLNSLRSRLECEDQHLKELRQNLEFRIEQRSAAFREELEHQIRALGAQLQQARKDRDACDALLRVKEHADRSFGQRTPEQVLSELESLRTECDNLQAALAERPDVEAAARLQQLEVEHETWQTERLDMQRKMAEMDRRVSRANIAAIEVETLRDHKAALESGRSVLQQALTELKAEINTLTSQADAKLPFPACSAMDVDSELQNSGLTYDTIGDLAAFAEDLRHRIAYDPEHPERILYYSQEDVRSFLAGLAMGPLVLLQGISGTGKTSLPMAFARAVGTKANVIDVQAGWRDPQDLVGHYNIFEKRFYEREFLKALYRARTPRLTNTIQIVLLDEMNLSHPEQYFSELLSALELKPEDRRLVLVPHAVVPAPMLLDGGSRLSIPPNVWFVGTANHDETTKDFADKTYDRAHVMQFPPRPEPFDVDTQLTPRFPVSFEALRKAFDEAISRHRKSANKAIEFLETHVRTHLAKSFEIGWGPRLEHQMQRYVPVVISAGGTVGEATDYLLAMRLLRKLKNRHDNRREDLDDLRKKIEAAWPELDRKTKPRRSTEILLSELRRLGWNPEDMR
jgi:hypothetical protein